MADLAGFDVIAQIHLETLVDLINLQPIKKADDGSNIYLLGGPVSVDLNLDLGPFGVVPLRAIVDARLEPMLHQSLARFVVSLKGGSSAVAGRVLSHIGGAVTVPVPLVFQAPASPPAPGTPVGTPVGNPVLLLGAGHPVCVLDGPTRTMADAMLGTGGADQLTAGVCNAVAAYLASFGTMSIPALGFTIVPGIDSTDPRQLSAAPVVAWIDPFTLGVFGYYRAVAGGGDVRRKTVSDLGQSHEEFFYDQPGGSVLPGRRTAILLSADAFERVLACPTVRNSIVPPIVQQRDQPKWNALIDGRDRAALSQALSDANFSTYFYQEVAKTAGGDLQAVVNRAKARVNDDVNAALLTTARNELAAWLGGDEGQKAITAALPEPCGRGFVEIARVHVAIAQSDLVPILRRLELRLADDRITVHYHVDGALETNLGDAFFQASGDVDLFLTAADLSLSSRFVVHPPLIDPGASGFAGTIFDTLTGIFATTWTGIMAYTTLVLEATLVQQFAKAIPQSILVPLPQRPFPSRLADLRIDAESILVLGLVCRQPQHVNQFNPALLVETSIEARIPADAPSIHGRLRSPATEWGCVATVFETTRTFWDTTVSVRAHARDIPLPITVLAWQTELGNFSVNSIAGAHMLDSRPTWSEAPVEIEATRLTLTGNVNHPDPPLVLITGPSALGHLQLRNDVPVDVTGDPDTGWKLDFHGVDGNFYVQFAVDVLDGDGHQWHGETFVTVQGDQLEMPDGYPQFQTECDAKYKAWFALKLAAMGRLAVQAQPAPGQPVSSGEAREAIAIRTLVEAGDPSALGHLLAAAERFGPGVLHQIGRVSPVPLNRQRAELKSPSEYLEEVRN